MKKIAVISTLIGILILAVAFYMILPVISFNFLYLPIFIFLVTLIILIVSVQHVKNKEDFKLPQQLSAALFLITTGYIVISLIASSSLFTWQTKYKQLKVTEVVSFDESVPNVDMENLIILDEDDARKTSEKLITEKNPSMGSQFQIGEGTLSIVQDKPYWIFPLEYRGFFKWMKNSGEIPGYIKVSATDFNDSEFVDYTFGVSPTGFLSDDLKRSIYMKHPNVGLTDFSFEVDDAGKGYWVVTAYTHETWVSTLKVLGTIIVDPVSKDMTFYDVNQQPEWVDRVFSMETFDKQLNWYGKYVNGWWNPSDEGKLQDTEGMGYVFKNKTLYFYTGMTSVGKDSATTGFVIYNPKNGEAEYNRISGSIEKKAVGLMEELVQNAGYKANFPYLINLNGEATYFSTLKGNSGNVVGYAFASVQNYKAVAWAQTLREAQTEYGRALLREGGNNALTAQNADLIQVKGEVSRVGILTDGYYILKLVGNDVLYVVNSEQFPMVSLTAEGDMVSISHLKDPSAEKIDAFDFVNESIR